MSSNGSWQLSPADSQRFLRLADDGPRLGPEATGPRMPAASDADVLDAYSQAVIKVVEQVGPSVVALSPPRGDERGGSGSGVIVTPDGYALTNSHVVAGRSRLTATTEEGDRLEATLVGDDPPTDLALLRLSARELPHAELADSEQLRVGQLVIAMGNPLGLQSTVSTGVVSSRKRSLRGGDGRLIENVIQHTAPINPGNSGGPLLDSRGRIVGINTAIIAFTQGLGFAVPSRTAQWVVGELLAHGRVQRRSLGIAASSAPLSRRMVRQFDLLGESAIEIQSVVPGGAADEAGLRPGDLLVEASGRIVESPDDLHRILSGPLGTQSLDMTIIRNGKLLELRVQPR
ncbi:MAG TPA: trypsin-like peptidase domain-containing protein [Pirellulaceae bacterium]|nr:trypsin-like peptidase domain-containing protein [Pirellulaceae bacterium]